MDSLTRSFNFYNTEVIPFKDQDFEQLKRDCIRTRTLFKDPYFTNNDYSQYGCTSALRQYNIEWKRAKDICKDAKLFVNSFTQYDVCQGIIGNCWFIAACAAVAQIPEVFEKIVPSNQSFDEGDYAGIFHFRFWLYGKWYDVVVDDYLPVHFNTCQLINCHNIKEPNEFWAPLVEKAYAKVYGSYTALNAGDGADALTELTGGIREFFDLKEYRISGSRKLELWNWFYSTRKQKSLAVASINSTSGEHIRPDGLVEGHEYSITDTAMLNLNGHTINLIRLRNPWANNREWNGPWSDKSSQWQMLDETYRKRLKFKSADDGEFWMSFDDFLSIFCQFQIVHLTPDSFLTKKYEDITWKMIFHEGSWKKGETAGGKYDDYFHTPNFWNNPQFLITIDNVNTQDNLNTVIIALMVKNRREQQLRYVDGTYNHGFTLPMSFTLYRVLNPQAVRNSRENNEKIYARNLQKIQELSSRGAKELVHRFSLEPGDYLIIPACEKPNIEGDFLFRVFSGIRIGEKNASVLMKNKDNLEKADLFFNTLDIDKDFQSWNSLLTKNTPSANQKPQTTSLLNENEYESAYEDESENYHRKNGRRGSRSNKKDKDCVAM